MKFFIFLILAISTQGFASSMAVLPGSNSSAVQCPVVARPAAAAKLPVNTKICFDDYDKAIARCYSMPDGDQKIRCICIASRALDACLRPTKP